MPSESSKQSVERLQAAVAADDVQAITRQLSSLHGPDAVHAISHLSDLDQSKLLSALSHADAAKLVDDLPEAQAAQLIERLPAVDAAAIVSELPSNEQADVISRLSIFERSAILEAMPPEEARDARRLLAYPPDTAGGLMITEYLSYHDNLSIGDVLDDLRANAEHYRRFDVQYAYVVSPLGKLVGVLRMRELVLSSPRDPVTAVMIEKPLHVRDTASLEELERFFDRHPLFGVPAVDADGVLVGVVRSHDVERAAEERASRSFLRFMGIVGGEELRSMPLRTRCVRRLSWLMANIFLNIIAASVIAFHQETLSAVIALAVFLPIISDMSGCSGNQAVAVSMRELTLGLVRPSDVWRVFWKEAVVGLLTGVALGLILGVMAWLWQGNWVLGAVVASALALNTLIGVCAGGIIPLGLRWMGQDPALAAGPLLTTITDMSGFFLVLTFAGFVLPWLTT